MCIQKRFLQSPMINKLCFYYFLDHTHKRITLLPDKLPEDSKVILTNLFSRGHKIDELSPKEANDILIRASPRDVRI